MSVGICRLPPDFPCGLHPSPGGLRRAQFAGRAFGCGKWVDQRQSCKEGRTGQGDREQGRPLGGQVVLYLGRCCWQVQKQSRNRRCTVYSTQTPRYCLAAEAQKNDVEKGRFVSIPKPTFVLGRNPCPDRLATTVEQTADFQTLQSWTFNPPSDAAPKGREIWDDTAGRDYPVTEPPVS